VRDPVRAAAGGDEDVEQGVGHRPILAPTGDARAAPGAPTFTFR